MSTFLKLIVNYLLEAKIDIVVFFKRHWLYRYIKTNNIDSTIKRSYIRKWRKLGPWPSIKYLKVYSSLSEKITANFVPENFYYNKIEPRLNDKAYVIAYTDKNLFQRLLVEYFELFPYSYLRCINGCLFDNGYKLITNNFQDKLPNGELIIKPSSFTAGGRGVRILLKDSSGLYVLEDKSYKSEDLLGLKARYNQNFVIQEKIRQHIWFDRFNEDSVNTVRMLVYRSVIDNKVHIINSVLRFGEKGSIVDNQAAGGYSIGINSMGEINSFKINKLGVKKDVVVDFDPKVPMFTEMKSIATKIAPLFFYQRLLGFDFTVSSLKQVKILEVNCKNLEIGFHQMNNGPLFGDFTDEIIEFSQKSLKTITFNFRIY